MKNTKLALALIFSILLAFVMTAINLYLPPQVQAGPLAGFTPTPPDDPGGGGGGDDDNPPPTSKPGDSEGRVPTDYVLVQMSQCNMLSCGAGAAHTDQPDYELLAYNFNDVADAPMLVPSIAKATSVEVIAPVRLVHDGSGFIAEGAISNQHSTRFSVPYPGQWELFLTGQPQFMTAEPPDLSGANLDQLLANLATEPISMGRVQANTETPQLVKCPIECVIEAPPPAVVPQFLPRTGEQPETAMSYSTLLIILGFTISFISLAIQFAFPDPAKKRRS